MFFFIRIRWTRKSERQYRKFTRRVSEFKTVRCWCSTISWEHRCRYEPAFTFQLFAMQIQASITKKRAKIRRQRRSNRAAIENERSPVYQARQTLSFRANIVRHGALDRGSMYAPLFPPSFERDTTSRNVWESIVIQVIEGCISIADTGFADTVSIGNSRTPTLTDNNIHRSVLLWILDYECLHLDPFAICCTLEFIRIASYKHLRKITCRRNFYYSNIWFAV